MTEVNRTELEELMLTHFEDWGDARMAIYAKCGELQVRCISEPNQEWTHVLGLVELDWDGALDARDPASIAGIDATEVIGLLSANGITIAN